MIYLVHHAEAVSPNEDPQRPLTAVGRARLDLLAKAVAARGVKPAAIRHSGKLRARQTAEAFLRECNPLAEFGAIRGLQPGDPPGWIRDSLIGEVRELMLVGHMPNLPRLLTLLVTGREVPVTEFPLHGIIALDAAGDRWGEQWRLQ
jgi:phosphohistidine phosphatase